MYDSIVSTIAVQPPHDPDADLLALERELKGLVVEFAMLEEAWPKGPHALDRARIGREMERTLGQIRDIEKEIAFVQARTLAGAAVQLRRLGAPLDGEGYHASALLASALTAIEGAAVTA